MPDANELWAGAKPHPTWLNVGRGYVFTHTWAHRSGPPTALLHHHGTSVHGQSAQTGDLAGRRKPSAEVAAAISIALPPIIKFSRQDGWKSGILVPLKLFIGFLISPLPL